ncbi:MAG: SIMPL domain-containing protein [Candidatus Tumulicola sp.]
MFRNHLLLAAAFVMATGACAGRPPNSNAFRANVSETLNVRLAPALVPQAIRALQESATLNDSNVSLQIQPTSAMRHTRNVATDVYTAALDDARTKAQAIAAHAQVALGSVQSVMEMAPEGNGAEYVGFPRPERVPLKSVSVAAPASGVVTLAVTYSAGNASISVFGTHAAPARQYGMDDANGLSVTIRSRDANLAAAQQQMAGAERVIRDVAARYGATANDIVITTADVATY